MLARRRRVERMAVGLLSKHVQLPHEIADDECVGTTTLAVHGVLHMCYQKLGLIQYVSACDARRVAHRDAELVPVHATGG